MNKHQLILQPYTLPSRVKYLPHDQNLSKSLSSANAFLPTLKTIFFGNSSASFGRIYDYFVYFKGNIPNYVKLLDVSMIALFSGLICALLGNLIWKNGTLDYIYLNPLFIFDLKDMYSNVTVVLFLIYVTKNKHQLKYIQANDMIYYFKNCLKNKNH